MSRPSVNATAPSCGASGLSCVHADVGEVGPERRLERSARSVGDRRAAPRRGLDPAARRGVDRAALRARRAPPAPDSVRRRMRLVEAWANAPPERPMRRSAAAARRSASRSAGSSTAPTARGRVVGRRGRARRHVIASSRSRAGANWSPIDAPSRLSPDRLIQCRRPAVNRRRVLSPAALPRVRPRRRRPRARRAPPTRAARRWRTGARRSWRGGRRSVANRAGTVAIVQSPGSTSSISSHVIGVDTVAGRVAAHRVGGGDRVVAGVLVVVDEHRRRVTVLAPPRRRHEVGHAPLDLAGEGERGEADLLEPVRRRDADVDVDAPTAGGLREAGGAELVEDLVGDVGDAAHRRPAGAAGIGSRSMRHSSGRSTSARREFHGWNSTVDICTDQITWASSVTHSSSACRP